jgi:hypothetical protein
MLHEGAKRLRDDGMRDDVRCKMDEGKGEE